MGKQAIVSGSFVVQEDAAPYKQTIPFDLAKVFPTLANVEKVAYNEGEIVDTDGPVTLSPGAVTNARGFILFISEGTGPLTYKSNGNATAVPITGGILLQGTVATVIITTAATQPVKYEYAFIQ